jgi:hypothetical protein
MNAMIRYKHTQIGIVIIVPVGVAIIVFLVMLAAGRVIVPVWSAAAIVLITPLLLAFFGTLTISVDGERLLAKFGIGFVRKSIPLSRIASFQPIRMRWPHGFGIHWIPFRGRLYNVSGLKAVEIIMKSGRHIFMGTDEPEALCKALEKSVLKEPAGIFR